MYGIIAWISYFVRTFCLPNPFEFLGDSFVVDIWGVTMTPFTLNVFVVGPILHLITVGLVGLYYTRHLDPPEKGSILYFLLYCIHVVILQLMGHFHFTMWIVILLLIAYAGLHIGYNKIKYRIGYGGV